MSTQVSLHILNTDEWSDWVAAVAWGAGREKTAKMIINNSTDSA